MLMSTKLGYESTASSELDKRAGGKQRLVYARDVNQMSQCSQLAVMTSIEFVSRNKAARAKYISNTRNFK